MIFYFEPKIIRRIISRLCHHRIGKAPSNSTQSGRRATLSLAFRIVAYSDRLRGTVTVRLKT